MRTLFAALLVAVLTPSQAVSPAPAAFSVAYLDVGDANRSAALSALADYRQASRAEAGAAGIDAFEQVGRPGHFVVIESWATETALAAHGSGAATTRFQDRLKPLLLSPPDVRPYKPLRVAAPTPLAKQALYVIAHVDVAPGPGADPAGLLTRHAEDSRGDQGNVRFDVLQHAMRANHFTVIEAWRDERALGAHASAAHTLRYRTDLQPLTGSPLDERLYRAVDR